MRDLLLAVFLALIARGALADVNDVFNERRLSIPSSSVSISFPREDWTLTQELRRERDTAVYYMHASNARHMFFSVYLDKTDSCKSAASCLDASLKNPAYKEAQGLRRMEQGPFHLALFHLDNPKGAQVKQGHVLASAYMDGVWLDVHLSSVGKERPDLAPLLDFLKTLSVK